MRVFYFFSFSPKKNASSVAIIISDGALCLELDANTDANKAWKIREITQKKKTKNNISSLPCLYSKQRQKEIRKKSKNPNVS